MSGVRTPLLRRSDQVGTIKGTQKDFIKGAFKDIPADRVPLDALSDLINAFPIPFGVKGRSGTKSFTTSNGLEDVGEMSYIPLAEDGNSYLVALSGTTGTAIRHADSSANFPKFAWAASNIGFLDSVGSPSTLTLTASQRPRLQRFSKGIILFSTDGIWLIRYFGVIESGTFNALRMFRLNSNIPTAKIVSGFTETEFRRRYLYTLCLRETTGGKIIHESGPGTSATEGGRTAKISSSNTNPLDTMDGKAQTAVGEHFFSVNVYSTLNFTVNSDGLVTNGVDREVYIFNGVADMGSGAADTDYTDNVNDSTLEGRLLNGQILKSRFRFPFGKIGEEPNATVTGGNVGAVVGDFLFMCDQFNKSDRIEYCSTVDDIHIGYSNVDQFITAKNVPTYIKEAGTNCIIISEGKTEYVPTTSYEFKRLPGGTVLPLLRTSKVIDEAIGVPRQNASTIHTIKGESVMAVTNDGPRLFDGIKWGDNKIRDRFQKEIQNAQEGMVGIYGNDKYYLWYRPKGSTETISNTDLLVYDFRYNYWYRIRNPYTDSGGDIRTTGDRHAMPLLFGGALALELSGNTLVISSQAYHTQNAARGLVYWIDTFDSDADAYYVRTTVDGSSEIPATIETRAFIGTDEYYKLYLRSLHLHWATDPDVTSFLSGFAADLEIFADEVSKDLIESIKTDTTESQEISAAMGAEGNRIKFKITTNKTDFLFRSYTYDFDERKEKANFASGRSANMSIQESLMNDLETFINTQDPTDTVGTDPSFTDGKLLDRVDTTKLGFIVTTGKTFELDVDRDGTDGLSVKATRVSGSETMGFRKTYAADMSITGAVALSIVMVGLVDTGNDAHADDWFIITKGTDYSDNFLKLSKDGNDYRISLKEDGTTVSLTWTNTATLGTVPVLIFTKTAAGAWSFYLEGVKDTSTPAAVGSLGDISKSLDTLTLMNPSVVGSFMNLTDFRIYKKLLTDEEITHTFNDFNKNKGQSILGLKGN